MKLDLRLVVVFAILVAGGHGSGHRAHADGEPTTPTDVERRVRKDLDAAYADFAAEKQPWLPPYDVEAAALESSDASRRAAAGAYLLALARMTDQDARSGRTPRRKGWSIGGPQDVGDEIRLNMARALNRAYLTGESVEALDVALWLAKNDRIEALRAIGAHVAIRSKSPAADAAIVAFAAEPHPTYAIVLASLEAIRDRKLVAAAAAVRSLCAHYRPEIASAAAEAGRALALEDLPKPDPKGLLPASILGRLAKVAALVPDSIPPAQSWRRLKFAEAVRVDFDDWHGRTDVAGWVLPTSGARHRLIDTFGHRLDVAASDATVVEESLAESARALVAARDAATGADEEKARSFTELVGMQSFVGHQGPWTGSLPEVLLAAWCAAHGAPEAARDLVLPLLRAHDDERDLFDLAFDQLASRIDRDMLDAFTGRDYDRALDLARVLAGPSFDAFWAQDRAKELLAEIPSRREDFSTRSLPAAAAWAKSRAALSREEQIVFLRDRLRLVHDVQFDIPGGVNWLATQYDVPDAALPPFRWGQKDDPRAPHEVINPFAELRAMNLKAVELLPLLPALLSEKHILAYDLPRFMPHYPRSLHRVRWLVASLCDAVLGDDTVDEAILKGQDDGAKQRHVDAIAARAREQGVRSEADVVAEALRSSTDDRAIQQAYGRLGALDRARVVRTMFERASAEPGRRAEWVRLAYAADDAAGVEFARDFLRDGNEAVAFWAAALLLRHAEGALEKDGFERVLAALDRGDPHARIDVVLDDLYLLKDARVDALVERYLAPKPDAEHAPTLFVVERAFTRGRRAAFDRLVDGIEGRGVWPLRAFDGDSTSNGGVPTFVSEGVADRNALARRVLGWIGDYDFGKRKEESDEAAAARHRADALARLAKEFALASAGKPTTLRPMRREAPLGSWKWVSSGWVLRTR